jgi:hypothetical protein
MPENSVEVLRATATRGDYASMARFARALYADGLGPREVLRQCYGVDFPGEFWVTVPERLATPHLLTWFTNQPWDLAVPPGESGVDLIPLELTEKLEQDLFARDADLVPLMYLIGSRTTLVNKVLCYRLTELRSGSTAVFGVTMITDWDPVLDPEPDSEPEIVRCGESLLAVLHAHHVEVLRDYAESLDDPANRGFGAVSEATVREVRSLVGRIETMQREVAAQPG